MALADDLRDKLTELLQFETDPRRREPARLRRIERADVAGRIEVRIERVAVSSQRRHEGKARSGMVGRDELPEVSLRIGEPEAVLHNDPRIETDDQGGRVATRSLTPAVRHIVPLVAYGAMKSSGGVRASPSEGIN